MRHFKSAMLSGILFLCGVLLFSSCKDEFTERIKKQKEFDEQYIQEYLADNKIQNAQRQASGIYYVPQAPGTGAQIQRGNTVKVHFIGRMVPTGQKFESTYDTGQPRTIIVGQNNGLPDGLNEGLLLLKNGERAIIIIPSHLAYGPYGFQYGFPANAVLLYDINVLEVK